MNDVKLPKKVSAHPSVVVQEVEDELVLLHMETEQYFSLDDVGTAMYKHLVETTSVEEAVTALIKEYDATEAKIRYDLAQLIDKLVAAQLLTVLET